MAQYGYESDPEDHSFGKSAFYVVTRGKKTGVGVSNNHQNGELSKRHALESYRDALANHEVEQLTSE
ncbi:hypothetical protein BC629DRAFT_1598432 [Irpex lacteus]|nr:hypothetical protein BC629DRAFT_1598432 [Irpex lacteus]